MKKKSVLVYGEYSGYGKSLVKGFREIGYNAEVFSFSGDGFKKINDGLRLNGKNKFQKMISMIKIIPKILRYRNILIMNPSFFDIRFLGPLILILLKITNKNMILLCCGDDVEFIRQGKNGNIENWPYSDIPLPKKNYFNTKIDLFINYLVATFSNKLIPTMYDYHKAWSLSKFSYKLTETIPLACDSKLKKITEKNFDEEKIVIMHGINREDFKGTKVIKKSLLKIKQKYGNKVEILFPEKLPLSEYLALMDNVDIAIDQSKGNSYGMNAIYSMFHGHVVLAPANSLFMRNLKVERTPIVSIENNEISIYKKLEELVIDSSTINRKKHDTQHFAVTHHDCKKVAHKIEQYLR